MLRPISRPDLRSDGARFAAVESVAVSVLLLLAVFALWSANVAPSQPWFLAAAIGGGLALYWMLQAIGHSQLAYWLMAALTALPHLAPAWSHNRIGWHDLFDVQQALVDDRSIILDIALFTACLVVLLALHRAIGIKRLNHQLLLRQVQPPERYRVIRCECYVIIALLGGCLLACVPPIAMAAVLTGSGSLLAESPIAIAAIGGAAAVLLTATLWLWFRGSRDSHAEASRGRQESINGR